MNKDLGEYLVELPALDNKGHPFLQNVDNWSNHRPLLFLGVMLAPGDIIEMGSGDGSTPYLKEFADSNGRKFYSYDSNKDWAKKAGSKHVTDWEKLKVKECGLCFIDLAPGEYRQTMIMRMKDLADIICVHDTEIGGAGDYRFDFSAFKYQLHYNRTAGGAAASLLSNKIDVSRFAGLTVGKFTFDA